MAAALSEAGDDSRAKAVGDAQFDGLIQELPFTMLFFFLI